MKLILSIYIMTSKFNVIKTRLEATRMTVLHSQKLVLRSVSEAKFIVQDPTRLVT